MTTCGTLIGCGYHIIMKGLLLGVVDVEIQTVRCHSPDSINHNTASGNGVYT